MITLPALLKLVNARKGKILLFAQACLPEPQFRAYRKHVLDQFGEKGLEGELIKMYTDALNGERYGNGRE